LIYTLYFSRHFNTFKDNINSEINNNNNNNNNKLQMGCRPVAVVIMHVYEIRI